MVSDLRAFEWRMLRDWIRVYGIVIRKLRLRRRGEESGGTYGVEGGKEGVEAGSGKMS